MPGLGIVTGRARPCGAVKLGRCMSVVQRAAARAMPPGPDVGPLNGVGKSGFLSRNERTLRRL